MPDMNIPPSSVPSAKKQKLEMQAALLQLPSEILAHCFEYLSVSEILQCSSVNSIFNEIGQSQVVWKSKCQSYFSLPNIVIEDSNKIIVIGSGLELDQLFINIPNDCPKALEYNDEEKIIKENDHCRLVSKFKHDGINNILKRWSETIELLLSTIINGETEQYWFKKLFRYYYDMYISGLEIENIEDGCKRHCKVRKLLNQMEVYLSVQSPLIADSISFSEGENLLNSIQSKRREIMIVNPSFEFAQLYLLTNGQEDLQDKNNALFGGYGFYDYEAQLPLPEFKNMIHYSKIFRKSASSALKNSYPVILNSYCAVLCASEDFVEGDVEIKKGSVYQMSGSNYPILLSDSFSNWFEKYVNNLTILNLFDIEDGMINRFPNKMFGSETVTNGVRIYCQSLLIPELSRLSPEETHYYFSYRIKISMDKNESNQNTCKLVSRHWEIYQTPDVANENPEVVDGPGVIGLFPKISPGSVFTYNSCTETINSLGYMKGYMTMKRQTDGKMFNAMIDLFPIDINNHI